MSGGWDSTSVFAAGRSALDRRPNVSVQLKPISMRYPEGDTGDESAFVESIAQRWKTDVRWVPVDTMPLFEDADRRAAVRDDPRVSPFESQIRTLCAVSRELGIRVVQDGAGGDHLFMVSSAAVLADHLLAGRLTALWREWTRWGTAYRRTYARSVLLPQFSATTLHWIGTIRGRPLRGFWTEEFPPWVRPTPDLEREVTPHIERVQGEGISAWETRSVLTTPLLARALSWTHPMAIEEGILLRSPLFDRRLIEFTATRPLNERGGGIDAKVVLRRAMRDLLPSDVLEARSRKTGTPADYFKRQMVASARFEFDRLFGRGRSRLEDLGVVQLPALKAAMDGYEKSGLHAVGAVLQLTMEAERWVAAQDTAL
jgi:asparagine synthetase B (glutamine-hydrolysing)